MRISAVRLDDQHVARLSLGLQLDLEHALVRVAVLDGEERDAVVIRTVPVTSAMVFFCD